MLCKPVQGGSEESYYLSEWTVAERAEGKHLPALAFAYEAKSERGWGAATAAAAAAANGADGGAGLPVVAAAPRRRGGGGER
jgi:hypothetical protein